MPGWSTGIANEFVRLAATDGKAFTQMHLQELVYIAHGWCLALTGEPLTGDRPEAREHGPEYRRIADALIRQGTRRVIAPINGSASSNRSELDTANLDADDFEMEELAIVAQVYAQYGSRNLTELAVLTRRDNTPWAKVYAGGAGDGRDIPHRLLRHQFSEIVGKLRA